MSRLTRPGVIAPRQVCAAWIAEYGTDRYSAAMALRPNRAAAADRDSLLWCLRHCCDYQPSLPELAAMTGFSRPMVAERLARFERETTPVARERLRARIREIAGGAA